MRTTNPEIFKIIPRAGGGLAPYETYIPTILHLLLVEENGSQNFVRVHNNVPKKDKLECGMLLLWDGSQGDMAQGKDGGFTDFYVKFTGLFEKDVIWYVACIFF